MGAVVVLAGLVFTAVAVLLTVAAVAIFFKIVLRVILLPLLLIKFVVIGLVMLVVGPILALVGLVAVFAMMVPLLPLPARGDRVVAGQREPAPGGRGMTIRRSRTSAARSSVPSSNALAVN